MRPSNRAGADRGSRAANGATKKLFKALYHVSIMRISNKQITKPTDRLTNRHSYLKTYYINLYSPIYAYINVYKPT